VSPVLAPPGQTSRTIQASQGAAEVQVLFVAARRRRRRRLAGLAVSLVLAAGAIGLVAYGGLRPAPPGRVRPDAARSAGPGRGAARPPLVAWFDGDSRLHVGDLATKRQRVLTAADAYLSTPLAAVDGRVYWVNVGNSVQFVQDIDLATGKIQNLGFGQSVFPSADGRSVFIAEANSITEVAAVPGAARRQLTRRQLTPPSGWYLPGGDGTGGPLSPPMAVADGVLVESSYVQRTPAPVTLGYWNLRTGWVTVLGQVTSANYGIIGAITAPGAGSGLAAWVPPACRTWCAIRIANTSTGASLTLRSPLRYGFALGGAFSPDGRQLAVFVSRTPGGGGQTIQLAIADTRTGALRLVPKVRVVVGAPEDWVRWLPGGRQLVVGGTDHSYLVTVATKSAQPFNFSVSSAGGVNSSAVIVPRR
jgi:hypothetical protein